MAKIKFAGLGGLNEAGRNMYFLEIDSEIFILDSGYSIPDNNNLGVEFIIPNFKYLQQNKDRIKGLFISHGHDSNFGALLYLDDLLKNIPIFTSKTTHDILKIIFKKWNKELPKNIFQIEPNKKQKIGSIEVESISVSHSIPGAYGFIFRTTDGNIVYLTDYIIERINLYKGLETNEFSKLSQENNLLVLSDSSSLNKSTINSASSFKENIKSYLNINNNGRKIFSCYEGDIYTIVNIMTEAEKLNKKVAICGNNTLLLIESLIKDSEINPYKLEDISNINNSELYKDLVVIFSKSPDKIFNEILNVANNENPQLKLDKKDIWINMALEIPGNEKICSEALNELSKNINNIKVPKLENLRTMNPSIKDLELVLSFLNPKYLMPIKSFYKEMVKAREVAKWTGMNEKNIILASNGEIHLIENSNYEGIERILKEVGSVIVESSLNTSISQEIIDERKHLSEDGIAIIGIMWSNKLKDLVSEIDIQMRGVMFLKKHLNIIEKIKDETKEILKLSGEGKLNVSSISKKIEKDITKILRKYINKKPIIIPHIMIID